MQSLGSRLSVLEEKAATKARKEKEIAVLIVREEPENIFTVHGSGEVLHGLEELHKFQGEHFVHVTIIDDIPRDPDEIEAAATSPVAGSVDSNRPGGLHLDDGGQYAGKGAAGGLQVLYVGQKLFKAAGAAERT